MWKVVIIGHNNSLESRYNMKTLTLAFVIGATSLFSLTNTSLAEEINVPSEIAPLEIEIQEVDTSPPNVEGQEVFHEVVKGDTLYRIAGYYHVDFQELLDLNTHFEDYDLIYPKDKVKIPPNQIKDVYFQHS